MPPSANDASRGSAIRLGAELAGRAVSLGTTALLAARLGVAGFGTFAALSGVAALLAELANGGLLALASRELVTGAFSLSALARAKIALSLSVVLLAGAAHGTWPLLSILALYFVGAGWCEFLGVALRSAGRPLAEAFVLLLLRASGLVLVALALPGGAPAAGFESGRDAAAQALLLSSLPSLALAGVLLARVSGARPGTEAVPASVSRVLTASLPLAVNGVLAMASLRVELLALLLVRGPQETGLFAAGLRIVEPLLAVPAAISGGAMPALTREAQQGEGPVRQRTVTTVAFLAVPAAVGLALVGPQVLPRVGSGFEAAGGALRLLACALVPLFLNTFLMHALVAAGRSAWLPRLTAWRLSIALASALVLVPWGGALGAAAGFLAAELGLFFLASRACTATGFGVALGEPLVFAGAATIPMVAALVWLPEGPGFGVLLGLSVYAATMGAAWRGGLLSRVFRA